MTTDIAAEVAAERERLKQEEMGTDQLSPDALMDRIGECVEEWWQAETPARARRPLFIIVAALAEHGVADIDRQAGEEGQPW